MSIIGAAVIGPTLHVWYGLLNRIIPAQTSAGALQRLALDQLAFAPGFIVVFMGSLLTLEGKPQELPSMVEAEWKDAVIVNWQLWVPANFINFRFMPPRFQVLFANVVALFWNAYLSLASHRDGGGGGNDEEGAKTVVEERGKK